MAFTQIAGIAPNYRDYKNWWLKAYRPGTTTPKLMSDNDTGSPTSAKYEVNSDGFIISSGGTLIIPHIDGDYDLWLFPTEAEADANDTTNAERLADDLENYLTKTSLGNSLGGFVSYEFNTVANAKIGLTIGGEAVTLKESDVIRIKERNSALFDVITGAGTANGYNIIAHATLNLSFVLRDSSVKNANAYGLSESLADSTDVLLQVMSDLQDNDVLEILPGEYQILGAPSTTITASNITVLAYGAEFQTQNSEDPETTLQEVYNYQFRIEGDNCSIYGLNMRGGLIGVANVTSFYCYGGRSYNLHNAGIAHQSDVTGIDVFLVSGRSFETSLATTAGNFTAIQNGALASDPKNKMAIVENCSFKGVSGSVNMHNYETVKIVNVNCQGGDIQHVKTDQGCNNINISGKFDGAAINPASANRHLSNPTSFWAFFSGVAGDGNFTESVKYDVELSNFSGTGGAYYSDTFSATNSTGKIKAQDCSTPVFSRAGGVVDIEFDLKDCAGNSIVLAYDAGTTVAAIDQTISGRFVNSRILVGNNSALDPTKTRVTLKDLSIDYNGSDGAIGVIDKAAGPSATIDRAIIESSSIKVASGLCIDGVNGGFSITVGENNQFEGYTTSAYTGLSINEYTPFNTGDIPAINFGKLKIEVATNPVAMPDDRAQKGDELYILNGTGGSLSIVSAADATEATIDGFSSTNVLTANSLIKLVKISETGVGNNEWRTESIYGSYSAQT